jgi:hypothetical protein
MPRTARIKPADKGMYYHLCNRIAGEPGYYPFGDVEKNQLVSLIKEQARLFTVEPLNYQVMGNHIHITVFAPEELLSPAAAASRYNAFYDGHKPLLSPEDPHCAQVAAQMRDISCFMSRLQQRFSSWFNRTRPNRRRGALWAARFKSTILDHENALWKCMCYIEMNACRAGLVEDPADYRFGSWGEWCATGTHPFAASLEKHLVAFEGEYARAHTFDEIQQRFRVEFARRQAIAERQTMDMVEAAMRQAEKAPSFVLRLDRRVRYWTDGVIIGTRAFILEHAARKWDADRLTRQHLEPAALVASQTTGKPVPAGICAWRRLRPLNC